MLEHPFLTQEVTWNEPQTESMHINRLSYSTATTTQVISFKSEFATKYSVKKICGEGSFGYVFEAIQNVDSREYAIKRVTVEA
ncbi:hypothetical protein PENTCL1PPCAC_8868, partial [Pristionchus entomophagus]